MTRKRLNWRCRFCGEAITVEQGKWATTDPNRDGPWYCNSGPEHEHAPGEVEVPE